MKIRHILLLVLVLAGTAPVAAEERIERYHAEIGIQADGNLLVTETLMVHAEGKQIRRGIYRDFPTRYRDRQGNFYKTGFQVIDVERNGSKEPWHTEKRDNGVRVYMGSAQTQISPGQHEYRLRYRTTRQLGFFDDYDELYWNVTGNGWAFQIERASARITLPAVVRAADLRLAFYTGAQGADGQAASSYISSGRIVEFETTEALPPRHGLTVALGWPKGLVHEPSTIERLKYFLSDNSTAIALLLGWLASFGWYLLTWYHHGQDPRKGIIIPLFEPPKGLSAAACRYVLDMGLRSKAFTAAVISLGVKGYLKIDENDGEFILYREPDPKPHTATEGEAVILRELLPEDSSWIALDNEHYRDFQRARQGMKAALDQEYKGRLFKLNTLFMVPAVIITGFAALVAMPLQGGPVPWVLFIVLSIALHLSFLFLLRAPTPAGRRVMDQIEGFKMYLSTAEQLRLERMRSPQFTPELFEMFLPYAFALGVENSWCERFTREFPERARSADHQTRWYNSDRGFNSLDRLGSDFGKSFSSAISSASTPPGSSSGSGGGGSSGGGGGGGGGGGW